MDWVSGEWMDWVEIFPTEEKEYKLTGMEELEVAAAILLIFLVTILTLYFVATCCILGNNVWK